MDAYLSYILISLLLVTVMMFYFRLATKYNIIDKPNSRSSHITPTIRGGGIIFPLAILLFFVLNAFPYPYFVIAVLLSGTVSFIDDIKDLPRGVRFATHIIAAVLIMYQAEVFTLQIVLIVLAFILTVGLFNAFNFMDGINGITGFYSLAILIPLMITEQLPINIQLQSYVLLALLIFLFFNARKKAKCFAGDVGSIAIAAIICFMVIQRIVITNDFTYLGFLSLYLVDTGLTIIQRATNGEKILEPHRKHLYQVMSNELAMPHLRVAILYALIQLAINLLIVYTQLNIPELVLLFAVCIIAYIITKVRLLKVVSAA